ncbi:hypothetical protein [Azospirillum sp. B2RO_4]|uniref:hypothetical protein n=1 Tax=Azospirillum sp. B2RO_4 TaxID=3027796 RepID=UPI003DA8A5AB
MAADAAIRHRAGRWVASRELESEEWNGCEAAIGPEKGRRASGQCGEQAVKAA